MVPRMATRVPMTVKVVRMAYLANSMLMSPNAFISSALPDGSVKNMVACLARLALEADVGLDDEFDAQAGQPLRRGLPLGHGQHDAEMAHRHAMAVNGIALGRAGLGRGQVGHDLVAVEVEVNPVFGAAAFGAAQDPAVEAARLGNVIDREGDVKRGQGRRVGGGGLHAGISGRKSARSHHRGALSSPSKRTALPFKMPGITSGLNPASSKSFIQRSGVMRG